MSWRDGPRPVRMERVALVAPTTALRPMLEHVGDVGLVELEPSDIEPTREAELERRAAQAVVRGHVSAMVGWTPASARLGLAEELAPLGAAAVPLTPPRGVQPPTLLRRSSGARSFDLLVETYTTVPYTNVDPTLLAGLAYVAMFGMMFGDVGHGMLLIVGALLVRSGRIRWLVPFRRAWPFLAGAGTTAMVFGFLYGEMFGPTGLIPVLWLSPLEEPVALLLAAVGVGALLLAGAYVLGTVNRVREGGWGYALYARTGIAGGLLFLALGLLAAGIYLGDGALTAAAVVLGVVGLVLAFVGLLMTSGRGAAGVLQAVVELFDLVLRLGSNLVSFARLAAFGLTHAALGAIVWAGTTALWGPGLSALAAVLLFVVGNAVAFTLEGLVAGIQALRLEYYELFSRVFDVEGRPFRPWKLPANEKAEVTA
ncbi:MAG TPA: V-type ATPase 116kDa subunit family protein [Jiangellaceae bacterium]|nr:V-type ATPase 116kDa subunit family protein [Jiangellaceae bacterium]